MKSCPRTPNTQTPFKKDTGMPNYMNAKSARMTDKTL